MTAGAAVGEGIAIAGLVCIASSPSRTEASRTTRPPAARADALVLTTAPRYARERIPAVAGILTPRRCKPCRRPRRGSRWAASATRSCPLVGTALRQGVLLADVLRAARPRPGATQVVGRSVDVYTGAFGLPLALDGRTALIALGMNGEPLPVAHGFPARLVVPGLYGYESAVKWLDRIQLAAQDYEAFWVQRGYANRRSSARSPASTSPTGGHCYAPAPCSSRAWCGPAPGRLPGPGQRRRRTMAAGPARRHHARRRRLAPVDLDLDLDLAGDSGSPRAEGAGHRRNRAGPARPLPRSSARRRHGLAQGRGRGTCATAGRPDSAPGPMRWWGRVDSVRYVSSRKAARPGWRGTVGWSG